MIEKPHLLLLPGMDGTGELFQWLVPALEPVARASVIRYPTDRPMRQHELADLVQSQAPSRPYAIVAESYSGPVALAVAAKSPRGLRGIILSTAFVEPPGPRWVQFAPLETLLRVPPWKPVLRFLLLDARCRPEVVTETWRAIRAVAPAVLASRLREILRADWRDTLRACRVPIVYLAAARDRLLGLRGLRAVQRVVPDCEAVTLDGPHLLLQARPHDAAEVIGGYTQRWFAV